MCWASWDWTKVDAWWRKKMARYSVNPCVHRLAWAVGPLSRLTKHPSADVDESRARWKPSSTNSSKTTTENDPPPPNLHWSFRLLCKFATTQSWTPLCSGAAPHGLSASPAHFSPCSVASSLSYASMKSGASLIARSPLAPLDFSAAAANPGMARADPFETLSFAHTGGPSAASSSPAERTQRTYGKAEARASASFWLVTAFVAPAASPTAVSAATAAEFSATFPQVAGHHHHLLEPNAPAPARI